MTARDFLGYLSALKGIPRKEAKDQIADVLEQVELSEQAAQKNRRLFRRHEAAPAVGIRPAWGSEVVEF